MASGLFAQSVRPPHSLARAPRKAKEFFVLSLALLTLGWGGLAPVARAEVPIVWRQTNGPEGAAVTAVAVSASQAGYLLIGTPLGVYRSEDGGQTWTRLVGARGIGRVSTVAIDPTDATLLYAGGEAGLLQSRDGGATWARAEGPLGWEPIYSITISPQAPYILYTGTEHGVYRSLDRGIRWDAVRGGLPQARVRGVLTHPENPQVVYAATDQGVYVSGDGGTRWYPSSLGLPAGTPVIALLQEAGEPAHLYAITPEGAFASFDAGARWSFSDISPCLRAWIAAQRAQGVWRPLPGDSCPSPGAMAETPFIEGLTALAFDPTASHTLYAGTAKGFWSSQDGGATWRRHLRGLVGSTVLALADEPASRGRLIAATHTGLYATENGGDTWTRLPFDGKEELTFLAVAPCSGGAFAAARSGAVFRIQREALQHLTPIPLAEGALLTHFLVAPENSCRALTLYAADSLGNLWHSPDEGKTWEALPTALPGGPLSAMTYVEEGKAPGLYAAVGASLYRLAIDETQPPIWQHLPQAAFDGAVTHLAVGEGRPRHLYAITRAGTLYRFVEEAGGWHLQGQEAMPRGIDVGTLLVLAERGRETLLVITPEGVFISEDQGLTWAFGRHEDWQAARLRTAVVDADDPRGAIYLGTEAGGVYLGVIQRPRPVWLAYVLGLVAVGAGTLWLARRRHLAALRGEIAILDEHWQGWDAAIRQTLINRHEVTPDLLQGIPLQAREHAMYRFVEMHRELAVVLREDPLRLEPARRLALHQFAENWRALLERRHSLTSAAPLATRLIEQLCHLLGFEPLARQEYGAWVGYMAEAASIRLSLPARFPIIFWVGEEAEPRDLSDLRTLMLNLNALSFFALLVVVAGEESQQEATRRLMSLVRGGAEDFIVLNLHDLYSLFLAAEPVARLVEIILQQIDLTVVSPYVTSGPVPENMFFGRDYELKVILRTIQDASYALVGGRKIGKTSVLNKLQRLIQRTEGLTAFYVDCHGVTDTASFFEAFQVATGVANDLTKPEALRQALVKLRQQAGLGCETIVFLLDEADQLVRADQDQPTGLWRVFRSLDQEGLCRFVFTGERFLYKALHDPVSPLYNAWRTLRLGYLLPRDVQRIVTEPMREMGLSCEDSAALVQAVIEMTACHPNLVQAVCQMLVRAINARGDRIIRREDIETVRRDPTYPDLFLEVVWGNASTLERLISVLMADKPLFTLADVREALAAQGCHPSTGEIEQALTNLDLIALLQRQGGAYAQGAPFLGVLLKETGLDIPLRESLVDTLQRERMGETRTR